MWGPLDRPPFPNENCPYHAQEVSTGAVTKDKWGVNPDHTKIRVVSDFVSNGQNESRTDDELRAVYFQVRHLIPIPLLLGAGSITILWDVEGASRTLNAKQNNWHLQAVWLIDEFGTKRFFVDLANPFGRVESQRNWKALAGGPRFKSAHPSPHS
jgi:hypothetical protein